MPKAKPCHGKDSLKAYVARLGSKAFSDAFPSYGILQGLGYSHEPVEHSIGEYVRVEERPMSTTVKNVVAS